MILFKKKNNNKLSFYEEHSYISLYSTENILISCPIHKILRGYNQSIDYRCRVFIECKFNDIYYPLYDLDDEDKLTLFKKIHSYDSYVIFKSSENHYWGITDIGYKNAKDIVKNNITWKICNDEKYVNLSTKTNRLTLRGLYNNYNNKPTICEINGNLSVNMSLFIDELEKYYNNEGFDISLLKYKDPSMLEDKVLKLRMTEN